ncbi:DUF4468 domain-containing protein [Bacteroides fragilis]|nr:DUF4468 domain-containing protein [Bacteroides fragilis]
MNKLTQIFLVLFMICLPVTLWADNDKDDDDSRYLAGAVPEVDGRVVFSREFSIPGMSQDEIYERMLKWLDGRMAQNKNNSRVVYKEKGVIAAAGEEWLVFSSTALSLDPHLADIPSHRKLPAPKVYNGGRENPVHLS